MNKLIVSIGALLIVALSAITAAAYTTVDLSDGAVASTAIVNTPNYILAGMGYRQNLVSYVTLSGVSVNVTVVYLSSMDASRFVTENSYTLTRNATVKHTFTELYGKWFKTMFLSKTGGTPTVRFDLRAPE